MDPGRACAVASFLLSMMNSTWSSSSLEKLLKKSLCPCGGSVCCGETRQSGHFDHFEYLLCRRSRIGPCSRVLSTSSVRQVQFDKFSSTSSDNVCGCSCSCREEVGGRWPSNVQMQCTSPPPTRWLARRNSKEFHPSNLIVVPLIVVLLVRPSLPFVLHLFTLVYPCLPT